MKQVFKPLGIAAAVAAASAGYVNVANAQTVANNALGDLALVPYYTVNGDWVTGIHIVNTSDRTQVLKFRFRRAEDSLDALDFNVVMSPQDVYAGFLSDDENGNIVWSANDTTCTVPATTNGVLTMPAIYREGAETGYVEIIGMGSPALDTTTMADNSAISVAAKHTTDTLTPLDCAAVRSNFFADGVSATTRGVIDFQTTHQAKSTVTGGPAAADVTYEETGDVLKVSYFIRDNASGVEFGDNAVHLSGFLTEPAITNQQFGWLSGDLNGFDFPDLDGGVPGQTRDVFQLLRQPTTLGVGSLLNEWTANPSNGAALDWVVTMPGQYTMMDTPQFVLAARDAAAGTASPITCTAANDCDFRDIPVTATVVPYNREELTSSAPEGDLTVSPALPGEATKLQLKKEVNVITFGGNSVLGVSDVDVTADLGQNFGWLSLAVQSKSGDDAKVCIWDDGADLGTGDAGFGPQLDDAGLLALMDCASATSLVSTAVPMIGFAAWARSVAANPDASYGRIIGHSFSS